MKILIIDDEVNIIQVIRLYLEQNGYTVLSAADGIAGLELHAREKPDLVILDLMLPALDGMEVCRRIRAWANTPILMLTARQSEEDRIEGLELGADDYLVKPFSPREVVSRVKAILRRTSPVATHDAGAIHRASPAESAGYLAGAIHRTFPAESASASTGTVHGASTDSGEELRYGGMRGSHPARRVAFIVV